MDGLGLSSTWVLLARPESASALRLVSPELAVAYSEDDRQVMQHGRSITRYQDMAIELAAWVISLLVMVAVVHAVLAMT